MKKSLKIFIAAIAALSLLQTIIDSSFIAIAHADTIIPGQNIVADTVWDKSDSPYILSGNVTVPMYVTLTIEQGVEVKADPNAALRPELGIMGGTLIVNGASKSRVSFDGLLDIFVNKGSIVMSDADITGCQNGISAIQSRVIIATSTVSGCSMMGIQFQKSSVKIWGSRITGNMEGIRIQSSAPVFQVNDPRGDYGVGGIGNALEVIDPDQIVESLDISGSVIADNSRYSIDDLSTSTAHASVDWWGSPDGPITSGANKVKGLVEYAPWLLTEPPFDPDSGKVCCSSILFLPGIEGTAIYRPESLLFGMGATTNTLWPPNRNDDARKLFLNSTGSSTDRSIYSGDPIGSVFFGLYHVYGGFMGFLDGLVKKGTVNEWKSFGYDWRKPIAEVVAGPENKATTTDYLIKDVLDMASRSKTGKVTIVAHSNGGLVAKYLVKALFDMGKSELIDSVISVAVPYVGTPQAIASILHGDAQSIAYGLILNQSVARQLGENMASAYSLLPSAAYFSKVFTPTIAFASTNITGLDDGSYPLNINSASQQSAFIIDSSRVRVNPDPSLTSLPIIGNKMLTTAADALHAIIDPFSWPDAIARFAIIGWNADTVKTVSYGNETDCKETQSFTICSPTPEYQATTTTMGDGTVVAQSAAYEAGKAVSVDLKEISNDEHSDIVHANIMESSTTQNLIENMIRNNQQAAVSFALPPGTAWGEPDYSKDGSQNELVVSTHSPVELNVYDSKGNHTGTIAPPPDVEEGLYTFFETKIPGSTYKQRQNNDNDTDSYIKLPDDGGKYSIVVKGTGVGTFDLDIDRQSSGAVIGHAEYDSIPVNPLTVASTTIQLVPAQSLPVNATSSINSIIASSTQPLLVDMNGDGSVDIRATSTQKNTGVFDSISYIESLRKTIIILMGNSSVKAKAFIKRLDRLEDLVKKGKLKKLHDFSQKLEKSLGHKRFKALTDDDKQEIIDMIDVLVSQYE